MTETTLWTNPNPISAFASQDVVLSDSFDNYKFIKIYAKPYKSSSIVGEYYFGVDTLSASTAGSNKPLCSLGCRDSSGNAYYRGMATGADHSIIGFVLP